MYGNESDAVLDAQESPESNEKLKRSLKTRHMNMIAIGGALGTGLFLASGASISTAGPGGALAAYAIIGVMVYFIMTSLGEMATYLPVSGSFGTYASRYVDPSFSKAFALECQAVLRVRNEMGLENLWVMIPFVRTLEEGRKVVEVLAQNGLKQGENGLKIIMMCEVPSNALLADEFLDIFDGFSIGSNDLTQLSLGLDRDSSIVAHLFDERNPAVKKLLSMAIKAARAKGKYVGICGQGPSDHPDLAEWLMAEGIESLSLNPDTVVDTWLRLAKSKASA